MPEPPPPPRPPTPRLVGPRPLPLHLLTHASTLMGSRAALPLLKSGSLPWKPGLAAEAESLRRNLDAAGPGAWTEFDRALAEEGIARHGAMLAGIDAYRRHPYARALDAAPELWREGTTAVRDYRPPGAPPGVPVLVVPSLVNRAYILDLTKGRSLMRDLARRGLSPFLVDWDAPGPEERRFTLTDYIARLGRALAAVNAAAGGTTAVMGYCMGGNLALALALAHPAGVRSLALLATPWDFHAGNPGQPALVRAMAEPLGALIDRLGVLPVDMLQAMFASLDPNLVARKFAAFARLQRRSARARDFVALEDWANDGVALAGPVARECLFGWYGANHTAAGQWRIGGMAILPQQLAIPTLVMIPERDRIVPPQSSQPLAAAIPGAQVVTVAGGHVGMLLSGRAKTEVYAPLAKWFSTRGSAIGRLRREQPPY